MIQAKALFRLSIILMCLLLLSASTSYMHDFCKVDKPWTGQSLESLVDSKDVSSHQYTGRLRIYITEPNSRFVNTVSGRAYGFGFLGYAVNRSITLNYGDTLSDTVTFNDVDSKMRSSNLMAIAAVFNSQGHSASSGGNPFTAYWVDAATAAAPGEIGDASAIAPFTHKVFIEEGTATWCQHCPPVVAALHAVYENGTHQMYYVAMVEDVRDDAYARLAHDYNISGYPTTYFDGGRYVLVGDYSDTIDFISVINATGPRVVRDLFLQVELQYIDSIHAQVIYRVAGRDLNQTPVASQPTVSCALVRANEIQQLTTTVTDADSDQIYVRWAFGDGDSSDWSGPYET